MNRSMHTWGFLAVICGLLLLPSLSDAASGWYRDRTFGGFKSWSDTFGTPDCATDPDLIEWSIEVGGALGTWTRCGITGGGGSTLQAAHGLGSIGGFTNLLEPRPFTIWPEFDTLGTSAPRLEFFGDSGALIRRCVFNSDPSEPCEPETVHVPLNRTWRLTYEGVNPPSELEAGTLVNSSGVITGTGIFAPLGTITACRVLENVQETSDNIDFGTRWAAPVTLTGVSCVYSNGTPSPLPLVSLKDGDGNVMTITEVNPTCVPVTDAATVVPIVATNTLTAHETVLIDITNSPSPTSTRLSICLHGEYQ